MSSKKFVKCVDNKNVLYHLTIGKVYEVVEEHNGFYGIIDDYGQNTTAYKKRFTEVSISESIQPDSCIQVDEETKKDLKDALSVILRLYPNDIQESMNADNYERVTNLSKAIVSIKKVYQQL